MHFLMDFLNNFFKKFKDHFVPSKRNVYRPHILHRSWLIFFVVVILTAESVFLLNLLARQSALDFVAAVLPGEVVAFTNSERAVNNLGQLVENPLLTAAAQAKAEDMAAKGYFSHVSPDGTVPWSWIKAQGYAYQYAGENLAVRFTDSSDVVNAWMASPTHRANIVKPVYTEIGVGVAQGEFQGEPATYVVQYFGAPKTAPESALQAPSSAVAQATSAPATNPQVEGASTAAKDESTNVGAPTTTSTEPPQVAHIAQQSSPWGAIAKGLLEAEGQPSAVVLWILGVVAVIMVIGIALTFFVHIQIQPTDILVGGTVVAVMAIGLFALNMQAGALPGESQAAAVFGAMPSQGGFIDTVAAAATQ
jgi:hypothetical protein